MTGRASPWNGLLGIQTRPNTARNPYEATLSELRELQSRTQHAMSPGGMFCLACPRQPSGLSYSCYCFCYGLQTPNVPTIFPGAQEQAPTLAPPLPQPPVPRPAFLQTSRTKTPSGATWADTSRSSPSRASWSRSNRASSSAMWVAVGGGWGCGLWGCGRWTCGRGPLSR